MQHELVLYLAERGEKYCMAELQKCNLDDLDGWHDVLDSLRSVAKQMEAAGAPSGQTPAKRQVRFEQKLAGFTKIKADETRWEGGNLNAEADTTLEEGSQLMQFLIELRKERKEQNAATQDTLKKLAAFTSGGGNYGGGGFRPSGGGGTPRPL